MKRGGVLRPSIFLKGGLGNQLFITAKAISIARESGSRVALRTVLMRDPGQTRCFELEGLSDVLQSFGVDTEEKELSIPEKLSGAISQKKGRVGRLQAGLERQGLYFDYYQQLHIVNSVAAEMTELLDEAIQRNRQTNEASISVHIRRGDYLHPEHQIHGALTATYFAKALDALKSMLGDEETWPIRVFSDGSLTREESKVLSNSGVRESMENGSESGMEMLRKLSSGRGIVMSNSSLSWWSAWLGSRKVEDFRVVCPFPWFRGQDTDLSLYDPSWNLVQSEWIDK